MIGAFIAGYKINSDLNKLDKIFQIEHNLDHSSFILLKSEVSPNQEHQFFEYQFDNGGFGYSRVFWSVIKNDSTARDLENGILPDGYIAIEWTNDNQLVIEKWEPYYFKDPAIELKSGDTINRVMLKLRN